MKIFIVCFVSAILVTILIVTSSLKIRIISDEELRIKAGIGPIMIRVYPKKNKKRQLHGLSHKKYMKLIEEEKQKHQSNQNSTKTSENKFDGIQSVTEALTLAKKVLNIAARACRRLRADISRCRITVGGSDAASIAIKYSIVESLSRSFLSLAAQKTDLRMNKNEVSVVCDYIADNVSIDLDMTLRLRILYCIKELIRTFTDTQTSITAKYKRK